MSARAIYVCDDVNIYRLHCRIKKYIANNYGGVVSHVLPQLKHDFLREFCMERKFPHLLTNHNGDQLTFEIPREEIELQRRYI